MEDDRARAGGGPSATARRSTTHLQALPEERAPAVVIDRNAARITAILLLLAAFAIRASQFGNPLIEVDENFYLLVGDRMLHGALPYVDIWDRKPIGIFLIYAAIRLLGGSGILQYQVVATVFAAATAFVVARIAVRFATPAAAVVSGILYLLLIGLAGGMGGQTPVFYNLLVAGAALIVLKAELGAKIEPRQLRRSGALAMTLVGVAMQIKYSAVFEGVFFGVVLLHRSWRIRRGYRAVVVDAAVWIGLALLPTLAALAYYVWRGEAAAFVYANFLSIGARSVEPDGEVLHRLVTTGRVLALPALCVLLSIGLGPWRRFDHGPHAVRFVLAWLGAALFGYFVFGTYFDHYALPLMVPVAIACAPLFSHRPRYVGAIAACAMLVSGSIAYASAVHKNKRDRGGEAAMAAMVAAIRPRLSTCLYVYDGDALLYYLVPSCIPTRFAFPPHLNLRREAGAIGVDPLAEIRRIFAGDPSVVVDTLENGRKSNESPAANLLARSFLRRDYRTVAVIPYRKGATVIYERRPSL